MAEELSPEEFAAYAAGTEQPASGAALASRVSPSMQAARDSSSLDELHAEARDSNDPNDQMALAKDIARRSQTAQPKEMSVDEFNQMAGGQQETPQTTPDGTPKITISLNGDETMPPAKKPSLVTGVLKEIATLGDMIIGIPGGAAGSLAEIGMQADLAAQGVSRESAEAAAREFGQFVSEKTQPKPLTNLVAAMAEKNGEEVTPGLVEQGMNKLTEWIDKGAEIVDEKTGGKLSKAEVQSEANLLMNLVGARALGKAGPKLGKKPGEEPTPEVENPINPQDGNPTPEAFQAMERNLREASKARTFNEKDIRKTQKAWTDFNAGRTEVEANRVAQAEQAAKETGSADPKLLAAVAVGAGGLALAEAYPDKTADLMGGALALGGVIGPRIGGKEGMSLGSIVQRGDSTLTTLERLNPNHTEFPKKRIEEELRRPDVTKAEKDVFKAALADVPDGGKVSAADLVNRVQDATGNFELYGKHTEEYNDTGLAGINRGGLSSYEEHPQSLLDQANEVLNDTTYRDRAEMAQPPGHTYEDYPHTREQAQSTIALMRDQREMALRDLERMKGSEGIEPVTTIWESPRETKVENHFDDPNYFAHSRSFEDKGVKHVVEIQSDLVQKNRNPADKANAEQALEDARAAKAEAQARLDEFYAKKREEGSFASTSDPEFRALADEVGRLDHQTYIKYLEAKGAHLAPLAPMWKDWHKRVVREELADSARKGQVVTRFATADTVAKVEGWPQDTRANPTGWESTGSVGEVPQRFAAQHQGIYDRYKKEVEPFLNKLGGKPVTDEFGHSWIEVPTGAEKKGARWYLDKGPDDGVVSFATRKEAFDAYNKEYPKGDGPPPKMVSDFHPGARGRAQMFGGATTDMMKTIAGAAIGLSIASQFDPDNPLIAGVIGALGGITAMHLGVGGIKKMLGGLVKGDTRTRITNLMEEHQTNLVRNDREVAKFGFAATELVKSKTGRERVFNAIDQGKTAALTGDSKKLANAAAAFFDAYRQVATQLGILDNAVANYTTHLWKDQAAAKGLLARKQAAANMSGNSRFNKQRVYLTMADGIAAGLVPLTTDIAEVAAIYGREMGRAIANKKLLDRLNRSYTPTGAPLVAKLSRAPRDYVQIDHPQLRGSVVHPDIAPSMKFLFDAEGPGQIMAAANAVNVAIKRNVVSMSLFHARSLLEAGAVAGHPFKAAKVLLQASAPRIFGENSFLHELRNGGIGDHVDELLKAGLKISFEKGEPGDIDAGVGFYRGMQVIQNTMDKVIPFGVGKNLVKGYVRVNHAVDNWMWGRLHAALKMEVASAKMEALFENNAKAGYPISREQAAARAADYANSVFGGLNWMRMAESAKTAWGRDASLALVSKRGMMGLNFMVFAPDWTLSTARAFYKTMGDGNGIGGLFKPKNDVDLYRQQLVRVGLYYATALNAINYAMSGHPIWENKDPTRIDFGDGRTMQAAKHSMEPFHWIQDWKKEAVGKLGTIPKETANQLLGTEYLSTSGHMPPMKNRAEHLGKMLVPISMQQIDKGPTEAALGIAGFSIYGKTKEERDAARAAARDKKYKDLVKQYRKAHDLPP